MQVSEAPYEQPGPWNVIFKDLEASMTLYPSRLEDATSLNLLSDGPRVFAWVIADTVGYLDTQVTQFALGDRRIW